MRGNFKCIRTAMSTNGDNNGPCNNDCEFLNITVFRGANKVYQHTEQPWPAGNWKNIVFSHTLTEEDGNLLWDGTNDNPIIEVTMKVKGDYQQGSFLHPPGDPAALESNLVKKHVSNSQLMHRAGKKPSKPVKTAWRTAKTRQDSPSLWPPLQSEWRCSSTLQRTKSLKRDSAHGLNR